MMKRLKFLELLFEKCLECVRQNILECTLKKKKNIPLFIYVNGQCRSMSLEILQYVFLFDIRFFLHSALN